MKTQLNLNKVLNFIAFIAINQIKIAVSKGNLSPFETAHLIYKNYYFTLVFALSHYLEY
jgi:hypothetical protein